MPFLTVVSKRNTDGSEPSTKPRRRSDGVWRERFTSQRSDLLDHLSRTKACGGDLRTVLDAIGPLLVKIMRADRGFIRLFPEDDPGSYEDLGVAGLDDGDSIWITESAFIERLLAGRFVRDGSTLLVPLLWQSRTVGFLCLDRHRVPAPFTDEEGHFLIGVGQAAMTLKDVPSPVGHEPAGPIRWDAHIVGRRTEVQKFVAEIRAAAKSNANILLIAKPAAASH